jgi:putative addiction module component (TIGR02574 family)
MGMSINTEILKSTTRPDVESAWSEEIKRRLTEIAAGKVELIPWEEVRAELLCCFHQS